MLRSRAKHGVSKHEEPCEARRLEARGHILRDAPSALLRMRIKV
jgi:hypothetical protein